MAEPKLSQHKYTFGTKNASQSRENGRFSSENGYFHIPGIFRNLPESSGIFRNCVCKSGGTKAKPTKIGFWNKKSIPKPGNRGFSSGNEYFHIPGIFRNIPGSSGIFRNCVCMSGGAKAKLTKIDFWNKKCIPKPGKRGFPSGNGYVHIPGIFRNLPESSGTAFA